MTRILSARSTMKTIMRGVSFTIVLVACSAMRCAYASDFDLLIRDLAGDDEARRSMARQMLPREGLRAVSPLLELLGHEDPRVWRAAKNVLLDICHAVGAPGHEKGRLTVTDQLSALLDSGAPPHAVKQVIRMLGVVTPEGYELDALRSHALQATWRGEVVGALVVMGTTQAQDLLDSLLDHGTSDQKVEIIEALRLISAQTGLSISPTLLEDPDAQVRVAAMRALAHTGSPRLIETFEQILGDVTGRLHEEAVDAYLHLAEAILLKGGNWESGIAMFHHLLRMESDMRFQGAALAGLGRFGDARAVPIIIDATRGENGSDLEAPALMALDFVAGRAAYEALIAAYPDANPEMQLGLLGVMGRKKDPIFLDLLLEAAAGADTAKQIAALEALAQSELPGALDAQ